MEFLDTMRQWIDKNANWIKIVLLLLLVFKAYTCHRELVTLLGGGMHDDKHKHHNGGGMHDDKHKHHNGGGMRHHKKTLMVGQTVCRTIKKGGGEAKKPLVIKLFWVDWCGHCQRFKPVWNKLKRENTEDVNYVDVNCEKEKEVAQQEGIQGFPTIRLYDADGALLEELEGSRDEENIKNLIKNHN